MKLEKAVVDTVEGGKMTKDLAILVTGSKKPKKEQYRTTYEFLDDVEETFKAMM